MSRWKHGFPFDAVLQHMKATPGHHLQFRKPLWHKTETKADREPASNKQGLAPKLPWEMSSLKTEAMSAKFSKEKVWREARRQNLTFSLIGDLNHRRSSNRSNLHLLAITLTKEYKEPLIDMI